MNLIPISEARRLAKSSGARRLMILAIEGNDYTFTTYGETKKDCTALARWADEHAPYIARDMHEAE